MYPSIRQCLNILPAPNVLAVYNSNQGYLFDFVVRMQSFLWGLSVFISLFLSLLCIGATALHGEGATTMVVNLFDSGNSVTRSVVTCAHF